MVFYDQRGTGRSPLKHAEGLREKGLIDAPREQSFDRLVKLDSSFLAIPVSLITISVENRQWFRPATVSMPRRNLVMGHFQLDLSSVRCAE